MSRFQVNGVCLWNYAVMNVCRAVIIAGVPGTETLKGMVQPVQSVVSGTRMRSIKGLRRTVVTVKALSASG